MWYVIFAVALVLVAVGLILASRRLQNSDEKLLSGLAGGACFVIAVVIILFGTITVVGANKVGIVTEFGKYQGAIQPGITALAPWADVEELPTRIQPLEMQDIPVRFAGNSGGTADVLVEWRVEGTDDNSMRRLWSDYRNTEAVQDRVVQSNSRNALNVVLAKYTPSDGVSGGSLQPITDATLKQIKERLISTGVVVERITIRQIDPDPQSQDRINRQVQAQADLERTEVTKKIAEQEAAIAATRQASQTPSSLQYECLRISADWDVGRQGPMPLNWGCFGGDPVPVVVGR